MPDAAQQLPTLTDADVTALTLSARGEGLGTTVTDVSPLAGGSQNVVVRLHLDGRPMVLRRPPVHPTSDQ